MFDYLKNNILKEFVSKFRNKLQMYMHAIIIRFDTAKRRETARARLREILANMERNLNKSLSILDGGRLESKIKNKTTALELVCVNEIESPSVLAYFYARNENNADDVSDNSLQKYVLNVVTQCWETRIAMSPNTLSILQSLHNEEIINAYTDEISSQVSGHLNEEILERLYAHGWKNHINLTKLNEDYNLNVTDTEWPVTNEYVYFDDDYIKDGRYMNVEITSMPFKQDKNDRCRIIISRIYSAINSINESINSLGNNFYVIVSPYIASIISAFSNFYAENSHQIYTSDLMKIGYINDIAVYVYNKDVNDKRILVGRIANAEEVGTHFCIYKWADFHINLFADEERILKNIRFQASDINPSAKLYNRIKYRLKDFGTNAERNYYTFVADV